MYLTYSEYVSFGGTASETEFNGLEIKARKLVDYRTFGRIKTPFEEIKRLVFELVKVQQEFDKHDSSLSGYGNDGVSVSFVSPEAAKKSFDAKVEELINTYAGDLAYRGCG